MLLKNSLSSPRAEARFRPRRLSTRLLFLSRARFSLGPSFTPTDLSLLSFVPQTMSWTILQAHSQLSELHSTINTRLFPPSVLLRRSLQHSSRSRSSESRPSSASGGSRTHGLQSRMFFSLAWSKLSSSPRCIGGFTFVVCRSRTSRRLSILVGDVGCRSSVASP